MDDDDQTFLILFLLFFTSNIRRSRVRIFRHLRSFFPPSPTPNDPRGGGEGNFPVGSKLPLLGWEGGKRKLFVWDE